MRARHIPVLLLVLAVGGTASAEPSDPAAAWSATIAFEAGVKLGGCDVGDLDPTHPGGEIAAVAEDGRVFLVHRAGGAWHGRSIAKVAGEMIQCAIGDADPTREGSELVMVGMAEGTEDAGGKGAVHLVYRDGDAWMVEPVFEDTALVHGVCIADVDPSNEGNEIVVVGFSKRVTILAKVHGKWSKLDDAPLPAPGKAVASVAGRLFVANTSDSIAGYEPTAVTETVSEGESEVEVKRVRWPGRVADAHLVELGAAQARLGVGGDLLLVACDDGRLQLLTPDGPFCIYEEDAKLRGAVLADLDPLVEGDEAATAGYRKTMTILYRGDDWRKPWTPVTLWRDTDRFHHLAAGELWDGGLGLELVAVGYSGRVVVAARTRR